MNIGSEPDPLHDPAARRVLWTRMRVPVFAFVATFALLAVNVALGAAIPSRTASFIEIGIMVCMILTVLLFSMEVREESPLLRFFAAIGFAWVGILLLMTTLDYVSR